MPLGTSRLCFKKSLNYVCKNASGLRPSILHLLLFFFFFSFSPHPIILLLLFSSAAATILPVTCESFTRITPVTAHYYDDYRCCCCCCFVQVAVGNRFLLVMDFAYISVLSKRWHLRLTTRTVQVNWGESIKYDENKETRHLLVRQCGRRKDRRDEEEKRLSASTRNGNQKPLVFI